MAEYIKRDAALRALCQVSAPTPDESYIVEKCIEKINRMPMMEVVRCKDCKHCKKYKNRFDPMANLFMCVRLAYGWRVDEDDFCSYGERREGE